MDGSVFDYWQLTIRNHFVKKKRVGGKYDDYDVKNTLPSHLGSFILSNSKRTMNNFVREINGFHNINVYYTDTDSLYIESNYWNRLNKAKFIGGDLCQGKMNVEVTNFYPMEYFLLKK